MTLKCWLLQAVYIHVLPVSPVWGRGLLDVQLSCTRKWSVSSCVAAFCYKMLIIAAVFDGFSSNWGASQPSPFHLQLNFLSCQLLPVRKQVENWEERKRAGGKTNVIAVEEKLSLTFTLELLIIHRSCTSSGSVALWLFAKHQPAVESFSLWPFTFCTDSCEASLLEFCTTRLVSVAARCSGERS